MTTDDVLAAHSEEPQLAANFHLEAELARALKGRDAAVEAAGRALAAAQRGNAVAQAVIQQKAALIAWTHTDNAVTRTRLEFARVAVEDAIKAWTKGTK